MDIKKSTAFRTLLNMVKEFDDPIDIMERAITDSQTATSPALDKINAVINSLLEESPSEKTETEINPLTLRPKIKDCSELKEEPEETVTVYKYLCDRPLEQCKGEYQNPFTGEPCDSYPWVTFGDHLFSVLDWLVGIRIVDNGDEDYVYVYADGQAAMILEIIDSIGPEEETIHFQYCGHFQVTKNWIYNRED